MSAEWRPQLEIYLRRYRAPCSKGSAGLLNLTGWSQVAVAVAGDSAVSAPSGTLRLLSAQVAVAGDSAVLAPCGEKDGDEGWVAVAGDSAVSAPRSYRATGGDGLRLREILRHRHPC